MKYNKVVPILLYTYMYMYTWKDGMKIYNDPDTNSK